MTFGKFMAVVQDKLLKGMSSNMHGVTIVVETFCGFKVIMELSEKIHIKTVVKHHTCYK